MAYRIPRGFAVRHPQYQEILEGQRPTVKDVRTAPFLPVAEIEPKHDDPIVIPAGTWVGILGADATATNQATTGSLASTFKELVPACANWYKVLYSSNDWSETFGTLGNVTHVDNYDYSVGATQTGATVVSTDTTASTNHVGISGRGVKPVGIAYQDLYASWLGDAYINYERQPNVSFLTRDYVIQVPAVTANEIAIEPGDLVMMDGYNNEGLVWSPATMPETGSNGGVGRIKAIADLTTGDVITHAIAGGGTVIDNATGSIGAAVLEGIKVQEQVVGRCLRKIKVAQYASATQGTALSTNLTNMTRSNVSTEFADAGRVNTVPGLSLQGSGLKGVPAWARWSTADSNGDFWVLEIAVGVC